MLNLAVGDTLAVYVWTNGSSPAVYQAYNQFSAALLSPASSGGSSGGFNFDGHTLYVSGSTSTYGGLTIDGGKAGWAGINFKMAGVNQKTFMVQTGYSGVYNNTDNGWDWLWSGGTLNTGTVPAANVATGTFGTGNFTMNGDPSVTGANYAITGHTSTAGLGGVIGYSQNSAVYGILGHANAYALYGSGAIYASSNIQTGGSFYVGGTLE